MGTKRETAPVITKGGTHRIIKHDYICHKDRNFCLPRKQAAVYSLLLDGVPRSAADISIALHFSDPRSFIRCLRRRGIPVSDVWVQGVYGSRFKRYFIRKEGGHE